MQCLELPFLERLKTNITSLCIRYITSYCCVLFVLLLSKVYKVIIVIK